MKIQQYTRREMLLYTVLIALLSSLVTINLNHKPVTIECVYKYDGILEFPDGQKHKITYNLHQ